MCSEINYAHSKEHLKHICHRHKHDFSPCGFKLGIFNLGERSYKQMYFFHNWPILMNLIIWPIDFSLASFGFSGCASKSSGNVDEVFFMLLFTILEWVGPKRHC